MVDAPVPQPPAPAPRRGRPASFWVALICGIVLAVSLLVNVVMMVAVGAVAAAAGGDHDHPGKHEWGERTVDGDGHDKIALVEVRGVITSNRSEGMFGAGQSMLEKVKSQLEQARDDAGVKAVVLAVESPGGEVTASDALHDVVLHVREKKPVVVHMGAVCASGGYYLAAAGDQIIAAPTAITGSIGVIFEVPDLHRLLDEKLGVGMNVIKTGAFKDIGSPVRAMRDDERALLQAMIDSSYQRFLRVVAHGRAGRGPVPAAEDQAIEYVRALADGRVFSGEQAAQSGLADGLGHIEVAYAKARELAGSADARIVTYRRGGGLLELFNADAETRVNVNAGVQIDAALIGEALTPRMEYRWAPLAP